MSSAEPMTKSPKTKKSVQITKVARPTKAAFWCGVLEGLGGPLMMGAGGKSNLSYLRRFHEKTEDVQTVTVNFGRSGHVASLVLSTEEVGSAISRATALVMRSHRLTHKLLREKMLDAEGKTRTVGRVTIGQNSVSSSDESR